MRLRYILLGGAVLVVSFVASLKVMDWLAPRAVVNPPVLAALPPLPAVRSSTIVVPVSIPLTAIRDVVEHAAPRDFAGKANNPLSKIIKNADIAWTATRGPIKVSSAGGQMALAAPINGSLTAKGSLDSNTQGAVDNALGKLLGGKLAKQIGVKIKSFNANADIKGSIAITARPTLLPNWRVEPNLSAQVVLGDSNVAIAGARFNVPAQVKPAIDKAVNDQLAKLQQRFRDDTALERNARREWDQLCRSIPLQGASVPQGFWLELRPTRAIAAQPRIDSEALTLTLGIEADTRITNVETKPQCPFPASLDLVGPEAAGVKIAIPVDIPFSELGRIVEAQFAGKTFPEDGSDSVTVGDASVAASGDRLLISLKVKAKNSRSFFGFTGDATLHIWGKPVLDQAQQKLRLTDLELAVESEAAFGLVGNAARAAVPYLEKVLAEKAVFDLKPAAINAERRVGTMIADLNRNEDGLRIAAEISNLKLADLAFDANKIRVTTQAEGIVRVTITKLPAELKP
ncbi:MULTISPECIES: DUF4403 family protein [Rhodopseudomonas]|uniref:DUF4403 family protein n=1 Tax=Rhodopseudomonas palustris TaxID=1076 RepID=A0A0D7EDJ4_RHOPL|nr:MULTISPECIES: DUF4403 family protein [Rhodopseudomonas]KIZ38904.1 hypothetical protein OO17_22225 [Rhodopseudomonas palustris]MDF3812836.1 DUF4403 family protein [Rhodopseudomonas sp. BAL398]WOK18290.1 DUF4403 family protein [Rhodopseudomonas sp. BAL398]